MGKLFIRLFWVSLLALLLYFAFLIPLPGGPGILLAGHAATK